MLMFSYTNIFLRNIRRFNFTQAIIFVHHKCPNSAKGFLPEGISAHAVVVWVSAIDCTIQN